MFLLGCLRARGWGARRPVLGAGPARPGRVGARHQHPPWHHLARHLPRHVGAQRGDHLSPGRERGDGTLLPVLCFTGPKEHLSRFSLIKMKLNQKYNKPLLMNFNLLRLIEEFYTNNSKVKLSVLHVFDQDHITSLYSHLEKKIKVTIIQEAFHRNPL